MRKLIVFIAVIFLAIITAGVYGILHDQVTYTISNEYYTKFKFYQFDLMDEGMKALPNPRLAVAAVGFMATWWTGFIIGTVIGITSMIFPGHEAMRRAALKAIGLTLLVTIKAALIGFLYGWLYLSHTNIAWVAPNVIDTRNFIIVGTIHNFSYLGGAIGLLISVVYLIKQRKLYGQRQLAA
jgi:hypothetical protein